MTVKIDVRPRKIFLVEDNAADVRALEEVLNSCDLSYELTIAENGAIARDMLNLEESSSKQYIPDIIFLDLNLPKKNGRELLKEIKQNHILKKIPIIDLTTSSSEEDISLCYDLNANCYITKPMKLSEFFQVIRRTIQYWCEIVELPSFNELEIKKSRILLK